jgi:hypothetical protein
MGERPGLVVLCFIKQQHQRVQAVPVTIHDVFYLSIFGGILSDAPVEERIGGWNTLNSDIQKLSMSR